MKRGGAAVAVNRRGILPGSQSKRIRKGGEARKMANNRSFAIRKKRGAKFHSRIPKSPDAANRGKPETGGNQGGPKDWGREQMADFCRKKRGAGARRRESNYPGRRMTSLATTKKKREFLGRFYKKRRDRTRR